MATAFAQTQPPASAVPATPLATPPAAPPAAPQIPGMSGHALQGGQGNMKDIIDIKPPVLPHYDLTWLYWLLGILAALALIALCVWLWKKKRVRKAAPALPPFMVAGNALDAIQQAGYAPREFYFQLSYVFRAYIENGLGVRALEKTTEELAPCLDKLPLDKEKIREAKVFLKRADPIKYAGLTADESAMHKDLGFVREVVEITKPQPEEDKKNATPDKAKGKSKDTPPPPPPAAASSRDKNTEPSGHPTEAPDA